MWVFTSISVILAVEVACRVPLIGVVSRLLLTARKAGQVVSSSGISDHWKERVLPRYAGRIFRGSLETLFWMAVVFSPVIAVAMLGERFGLPVVSFLSGALGIAFSVVVGLVYHAMRSRVICG